MVHTSHTIDGIDWQHHINKFQILTESISDILVAEITLGRKFLEYSYLFVIEPMSTLW